MSNFHICAFTLLGLTLSACGGSSGVTPISQDGFATAGERIGGGDTFTIPNAFRLISDGSDVIIRDQQDVQIAIGDDGSTVDVTLAGDTYTLASIPDGYEFYDGENLVLLRREFAPVPEAEIVLLYGILNEDNLNASLLTFGFDTDPAEVASASGQAVMQGEILIAARQGFTDSFGSGPVTLNVDFDANTIGGNFTIFDGGNSEAVLPTVTFAFDETEIVENGFDGSLSLTSGDLGGTLSDTAYTGRFFGAGAPTAGGQIVANVTDDAGRVTLIEGAFLATED